MLVDPPRQTATAIAFSNASRVMMSRGRMPCLSNSIAATPLSCAICSRVVPKHIGLAEPGNAIPIASAIEAIVFAVNIHHTTLRPDRHCIRVHTIPLRSSSRRQPPRLPRTHRQSSHRDPENVPARCCHHRRIRRANSTGQAPSVNRANSCRSPPARPARRSDGRASSTRSSWRSLRG